MNDMFNKKRVKRAMEKRRKQKHMPFKSDAYTDPFYTEANFNRLRLSIARLKAYNATAITARASLNY